jgi:hypothetical protein
VKVDVSEFDMSDSDAEDSEAGDSAADDGGEDDDGDDDLDAAQGLATTAAEFVAKKVTKTAKRRLRSRQRCVKRARHHFASSETAAAAKDTLKFGTDTLKRLKAKAAAEAAAQADLKIEASQRLEAKAAAAVAAAATKAQRVKTEIIPLATRRDGRNAPRTDSKEGVSPDEEARLFKSSPGGNSVLTTLKDEGGAQRELMIKWLKLWSSTTRRIRRLCRRSAACHCAWLKNSS